MKTHISKIIGKPSDYWVCEECNGLNWYENEDCSGENQGCECEGINPMLRYSSKMADYEEILIQINKEKVNKVLEWVDEQLEFYKEEYDYTEDDCDNIEIYI